MLKRTQLTYDAQCILAHETGTLPSTAAGDSSKRDIAAARANFGDGRAMSAALHRALENLEIEIPPTVSGLLRKRFSDSHFSTAAGRRESPYGNPRGSSVADGGGVLTVFLVDIEGTTTPLTYVREVMMPLALRLLPAFMQKRYPADADAVEAVRMACESPVVPDEAKEALRADLDGKHSDDAATQRAREVFVDLVEKAIRDRSSSAFAKKIQGMVWQEAESMGELHTTVFRDFVKFLQRVGPPPKVGDKDNCMRVVLYSTGSVQSQKLLMRNAKQGDLTPYIAGYVDPSMVGSKLGPTSYSRIRSTLCEWFGCHTKLLNVVFLTDNPSEASIADSSSSIDCSILVVRPLNAWVTYDRFVSVDAPAICSFAQLFDADAPVKLNELVDDVADLLHSQNRDPVQPM